MNCYYNTYLFCLLLFSPFDSAGLFADDVKTMPHYEEELAGVTGIRKDLSLKLTRSVAMTLLEQLRSRLYLLCCAVINSCILFKLHHRH